MSMQIRHLPPYAQELIWSKFISKELSVSKRDKKKKRNTKYYEKLLLLILLSVTVTNKLQASSCFNGVYPIWW